MEHFSNQGQRRRREYPKEFKAQVLAECGEPGVSVGGVALAHGLHSNMVHRWIREARQAHALTAALCPGEQQAFIALPLSVLPSEGLPTGAAALPAQPPALLELRLQRGDLVVSLSCPAGDCGALLREVLR